MDEALRQLDEKIDHCQEEIAKLEMIKDAVEQERSPFRDRVVVRLGNTYVATHRWEVNPGTGYITVQLQDGSILPTRLGHWCLQSYADDFFSIDRSEIKIDDNEVAIMDVNEDN
jgi:hypothetical protein